MMLDLNQFIGIIPARYASSRFPGKPLVEIGGKLMIERVYEQASKAIENVYVATDDARIFEAVERFGGKVIMTSDLHKSGTDRCYEAVSKLKENFEVVINIQGDEPFIHPSQIEELMSCFTDENVHIATLVKQITANEGVEFLQNPNHPKVVLNKKFEAMYFSRSVVPFVRGEQMNEWTEKHPFYKHIGMYAYRTKVLKEITQLEQSPLEIAESLEQLRWLENGYNIKVGFTDRETIGIDTPEDLERVKKLIID